MIKISGQVEDYKPSILDEELPMKLFNVCSRRFYEKDGEKKIKWYKVGFLKITDTGKKYLHLFLFPETEFFLFEKEEKEETVPEIQLEE